MSRNELEYREYYSASFNPFDKPKVNTNTKEIKALLLVQTDIVKDILSDRQKYIVNRVICERVKQKVVARELGITPSALCRELQFTLKRIKTYLFFCKKALEYYNHEEVNEE